MSLSGLPTELIVHVFKSVDNISSAAALSHTSRQFHAIWRYNLTSICDAVLPWTIECYDQAYQLLEARAKSDLVVTQSSVEDKAKAAIVRARVLFTNADLALSALEDFEIHWSIQWEIRSEHLEERYGCTTIRKDQHGNCILEPLSRVHFLQGFYRAMSLVYLAGKSITKRYQLLASMSLLDFFRLCELVEWIVWEWNEDQGPNEEILLPGYDSRPRVHGEEYDTSYWHDLGKCLGFLDVLDASLKQLSGVERPINEIFLTDGPAYELYQLVLNEDCQKGIADRAKGIALADLLPLLPENNVLNTTNELCDELLPERLR